MTTLNNELVNELAAQIISNETNEEAKEYYYTMLFQELDVWKKDRARTAFNKLRGYGATYEDILGHFDDTIQLVLEGKAFTTFDKEKGNFVSVVFKQVRNPLKNYSDYLQSEKRAVKNTGISLNQTAEGNTSSSIGDLIASGEPDMEESVVNSLDTTNLLAKFAQSSKKDGEAKAKAIYFLMYPEQYDTQHIADVLGHADYDAAARKKMERIRKEFAAFMSQQ